MVLALKHFVKSLKGLQVFAHGAATGTKSFKNKPAET
jgi:hypothetical protein